MILSHLAAYYLLLCVEVKKGELYPLPSTTHSLTTLKNDLKALATPTQLTWVVYLGFLLLQIILALGSPGPTVYGYPVTETGERVESGENYTSQKNQKRLKYTCNALVSWWVTLANTAIIVYAYGDAPLLWLADNRGRLLTVAVILANTSSLLFYLHGRFLSKAFSQKNQKSKNYFFDFFMGVEFNPRSFFGKLDWKLLFECRVSWVLLFLLTLSAVGKQARNRQEFLEDLEDDYNDDYDGEVRDDISDTFALPFLGPIAMPINHVSSASLLILTAHWLYTNAVQKGEHYVPFTFDVYKEKFGWMLVWWNAVGVPFLYTSVSFIVAENDPRLSYGYSGFLWVTLLSSYYVWDTAQSQRVTFRAKRINKITQPRSESCFKVDEYQIPWGLPNTSGLPSSDENKKMVPLRRRFAFPTLPWSELKHPDYIATRNGGTLLTSGLTGMAWKIHYTCDFLMACVWAGTCGGSPFEFPVAYVYPLFFAIMISHRARRDEKRMRAKYQEDWMEFKKKVSCVWVPGVF